MTSLFMTGGKFLGLPVLAAVIVVARVVGPALPDRLLVRWGLRAVLFLAVITALGLPDDEVSLWYIKPEFMRRIGVLLAAELALRAWIVPLAGKISRSWGEGLVISGLVVICSTTTYEDGSVAVVAPLYVIAAILTARQISKVNTSRSVTTDGLTVSRRRRMAVAQQVTAVVLALSLGLGGIFAIKGVERTLSSWAAEFTRNYRSQAQEIGLSKAPQLRQVFNPSPSMERTLRLENARGERHIRVMAFDRYEAQMWYPRSDERRFQAMDSRHLRADRPSQKITVVPLSEGAIEYLAIPTEAVGLTPNFLIERDQLGILRPVAGERAASWTVETPGAEGATIPLLPSLNEEEKAALLGFPKDVDYKVAELAREIAGTGSEETRVLKILHYLRSNHRYSLRYHPDGEPLTDFILNRQSAHCQYFASAMVVMARAAGVPARFVTGFYAYEPDGDDSTMVRERDAHAWAECYIQGKGWVVADATPASGRPDQLFDQPTAARKTWEAIRDFPGKIRRWLEEGGLRVTGLIAALLLGGYGIIWITLRVIAKWRVRKDGSYERLDPALVQLRSRIEKLLTQRGVQVEAQKTWRETLKNPSEQITVLLDGYDRLRFGKMNETSIQKMNEEIAQLEKSKQ